MKLPLKKTTETELSPLEQLVETEKVTKESPKIIVCFSAVTANGGKHCALNLALTHQQKFPNEQIALVDLDFTHPTLLANETSYDKVHGIDNLLDKIDSEQLTEVLFRDNMIKVKDTIHFLKGTQLGSNHLVIERKHIETIFQFLKEGYDRVFVCVSGLDNNAGMVYGLHNADCVLMILNNNYTNFSVCDSQLNLIERYFHKPESTFGVFNKFNSHSKAEFGDWLASRELKIIGTIPYDEKAIDGNDWFGSLILKTAKKASKTKTAYDFILEKIL